MAVAKKKYDLIASELRGEILSKQWAVGGKLPTEPEIARRFECSLGTVSKALGILNHEGLIQRQARVGTTVISSSLPDNSLPERSLAVELDAFAVIYPSRQHEGISRIVQGFHDAAGRANRRVLMLTTGIDFKQEVEIIDRLSEFDVRGALVYPVYSSPSEMLELSQTLIQLKVPMVLTGSVLPGLGHPTVEINGFHSGYTMTRHMIGRGVKRIGYFSNNASAPLMRERYRGYAWAMREAAIPEPENGVFLETAMHPDFNNPLAEPTLMAEGFLRKSGKLDAVVCGDDFLARGCIAASAKLGIRVPDDMLVSGIDDYTTVALSAGVSLTTYRIPFEEVGRKAFEVLNQIVSGGEVPHSINAEIYGEIVIRESA